MSAAYQNNLVPSENDNVTSSSMFLQRRENTTLNGKELKDKMHHILQKRDLWRLWSFHSISFVHSSVVNFIIIIIIIIVIFSKRFYKCIPDSKFTWIPDSISMWILPDSSPLDSGF